MRTVLTYTAARLVLLVAAGAGMYLAGARGLLLVALAFVVSGLLSYVLLSKQRDALSGRLASRTGGRGRPPVVLQPWYGARRWLADVRYRVDAGTRIEDED